MNAGYGQSRHIIGWALIAVVVAAIIGFGVFGFLARGLYSGAYYYPFPFFHPFGFFFGFFWLFIIIWVISWLFWPRRWGYRRWYWRYGDESYYILRQRYARGEITKEQFEQMMRDLREQR